MGNGPCRAWQGKDFNFSHIHLKRRIKQYLLIRESADFKNKEEYDPNGTHLTHTAFCSFVGIFAEDMNGVMNGVIAHGLTWIRVGGVCLSWICPLAPPRPPCSRSRDVPSPTSRRSSRCSPQYAF